MIQTNSYISLVSFGYKINYLNKIQGHLRMVVVHPNTGRTLFKNPHPKIIERSPRQCQLFRRYEVFLPKMRETFKLAVEIFLLSITSNYLNYTWILGMKKWYYVVAKMFYIVRKFSLFLWHLKIVLETIVYRLGRYAFIFSRTPSHSWGMWIQIPLWWFGWVLNNS